MVVISPWLQMIHDVLSNIPEPHDSNSSINKDHLSRECRPFNFTVDADAKRQGSGLVQESERCVVMVVVFAGGGEAAETESIS